MGNAVFERMVIKALQKTESDRKSTRFDFATLHGKPGVVAVMSVPRSFAGFNDPNPGGARQAIHLCRDNPNPHCFCRRKHL
jgi:hypothetical protein